MVSDRWCEGEIFEFMREYGGLAVYDDRWIVAIRGGNPISCTLNSYEFTRIGRETLNVPHINHERLGIPSTDLQESVVYRIVSNTLRPVLQVRYGSYVFHYDLDTWCNDRKEPTK